MDWFAVIFIAIALSMDCLAVSMACGIKIRTPTPTQSLRLAAAFGGAQALMPIIGWLCGRTIINLIEPFDHWLAFGLLALIGGKMILEYMFEKDEKECRDDPTSGRDLYLLTIATSIDALAVGLSLAFVKTGIAAPAAIIGITSFLVTLGGIYLGVKVSQIWGRRMELAGGLILIGIGARILLEHMK